MYWFYVFNFLYHLFLLCKINPKKRATAADALLHQWLDKNPNDTSPPSHKRDPLQRDSNSYDEKSEEKQSRFESGMKGDREQDEKNNRFEDDIDFARGVSLGEEKNSHDGIGTNSRGSDDKQSSYKSDV